MLDTVRMDPLTAASLCVIGLVLTTLLLPLTVGGVAAQPSQPGTDNTVTRIHVSPNGSAQWTIQIRTRLDTEDSVDEYEAFQRRFRENTSRYIDPFQERMQGVVANAANATGREMRVVNFTTSTSIQEVPRRWGVVTYRFTWTNFAAQQNDTLVVGDVFQGGFFLAANDTLEIDAPAEYEIARVEPASDSEDEGVVTWVGREDFANRHPRVVFTPTTNQGDAGFGVVVGGTIVLGVLSIGAYSFWRRRDRPGTTKQSAPASSGGDSTAGSQTSTSQAAQSDDPVADADVDGEVLTDTERVQELLEASDGRMRQTEIAEEFDWSASKTSRVIGKMVDEGTVEKLQLGRENLIDLGDTDE